MDPTVRYFEEISRHHYEVLEKVNGTVRFDIADGERTDRWTLVVQQGDIRVSGGGQEADCIIRLDRALFDRLATGEESAIASLLRGGLTVEGDLRLLFLMGRLLPGPQMRLKNSG